MADLFLWHVGVWPGYAPQPGVAWPRSGPVEHGMGWGAASRSYEGAVLMAVPMVRQYVRPTNPVAARFFPYDRVLVTIERKCDDCVCGTPRAVLERQRVTGNYRIGRKARCRCCDGSGVLFEVREDLSGERLVAFLDGAPTGMKAA